MSENSVLSGVAEDFSRLTLECASGQIVFRMNARGPSLQTDNFPGVALISENHRLTCSVQPKRTDPL